MNNTSCAKTGNNMTSINLDNTQNWCLGRYTFVIPKEATFYQQRDQYDSFTIKKVQMNATQADFDKQTNYILSEYTKRSRQVIDNLPVEKYGTAIAKIIRVKISPAAPLTQIFAFVLDRNQLFYIEGSYGKGYKEESAEAINHLVSNLKARSDNEIPKEAGVCIYKGFIKDNGQKYRHSLQSLVFDVMPKYPTVLITLETEANISKPVGMIKRVETELKEQGVFSRVFGHIKTIKKGSRTVNGRIGDEWITDSPMKGKNGLNATWEYAGLERNGLEPSLQVDVDSGNETDVYSASISHIETQKLYELILNSMKKF